jgi:hypothetical protein
MRLEGLGKLKNKNCIRLTGSRTRDFPARSTVPQLTKLSRAPCTGQKKKKNVPYFTILYYRPYFQCRRLSVAVAHLMSSRVHHAVITDYSFP